MKRIYAKRFFKVLLVVALLGLLVSLNPKGFFSPFRYLAGKILYPFEGFSYSISHKFNGWTEFIFSIGQLKDENKNLLQENQKLVSENARLHDMERENNFLREQIGILPRDKFDLQASFIISQDPQGFGNYINISRGEKDGLKEGMAVIISNGILVGRIEEVFADRSLVMLVTNPKSVINVVVSQSGAKGLARGEFGLGLIADSILQTDAVSPGNEIVTSGAGGEIPKGLLVGIVQEVRPSADHLFRQAILSSPVKFSAVEIVFVVKGSKQ